MSNFAKPDKYKRNPAKYFLEWIGAGNRDGGFAYWEPDEKKNIEILDLQSFRFILLDDNMMGFTGFYKEGNCGMYSNEVPILESASAVMKVRAFDKAKTVIAEGHYQDIKNDVKAAGGKFFRSLYILTDMSGTPELWNIKSMGCAIGPYMKLIELSDKGVAGSTRTHWIQVVGVEKQTTGGISFTSPKFAFTDKITEDDEKSAIELATVISEYLDAYSNKVEEEVEEETEEKSTTDTSNWREYNIPATSIILGEKNLEELLAMKGEQETIGEFDVTYDNICAGVQYHQQKAKEESEPKNEVKSNPFFNKPEPEPEPEKLNWRECVIEESGRKLSDSSTEEIQAMASYCESPDGEAFKKYLPMITAALKELAPF